MENPVETVESVDTVEKPVETVENPVDFVRKNCGTRASAQASVPLPVDKKEPPSVRQRLQWVGYWKASDAYISRWLPFRQQELLSGDIEKSRKKADPNNFVRITKNRLSTFCLLAHLPRCGKMRVGGCGKPTFPAFHQCAEKGAHK